MRRFTWVVVALMMALGVASRAADDEVKLIYTGELADFAMLGSGMDMEGSTVVAGASNLRQVVFFTLNGSTWTQQAIVSPSQSEELYSIWDVALSGNTAVVGDFLQYGPPVSGAGVVYIFVRNGTTWTEQARLNAPIPANQDGFGWSVAISGNTLAVGAKNEVYIYTRSGTTWSLQETLISPDSTVWFNTPIALDETGNKLAVAVSTASKDELTQLSGAVYVFTRSGSNWTHEATLFADDAQQYDSLGIGSIAFSGDTIITATGAGGSNYNAAYIFHFDGSTWSQQAKIPSVSIQEAIGAVDIDGDRLVIGTLIVGPPPRPAGAAYVYTRSGGVWTQEERLAASDGHEDDEFGAYVAVSGGMTAVSALFRPNGVGQGPGGVYIYGSGGVFRPPSITSARVVGLEAIQTIQDLRNSVPLVKDKFAIVRAHVQPHGHNAGPVQLVLYGERNGVPLPGSPLPPTNGTTFFAQGNAYQRRAYLNGSPYFELPTSWLNGTVALTLKRADGGILYCREDAQNPSPGGCPLTVYFRPVGTLRVRLFPIRWQDGQGVNYEPSNTDMGKILRRLQAIYPAARLSWSIGQTIPFSGNWNNALTTGGFAEINRKLVRQRGSSGELCNSDYDCDPLYLGIIKDPTRWGGLSHSDVGSGSIVFVEDGANLPGRNTAAHELAHMLRRDHIAFCGATPPTVPFPFSWYNGSRTVPTIGPMNFQDPNGLIYGLDTSSGSLQILDPRRHYEIMSYCDSANGYQWISDVTYKALLAAINNNYGIPPSGISAVNATIMSNYLIVSGQIDLTNNVAVLDPLLEVVSSASIVNPTHGTYNLQLLDATNAVLSTIPFEPDTGSEGENDLGLFLIAIPADPAIKHARIVHNSVVIGSISASANAPTITITAPNGGETLDGTPFSIEWTASDPDGGDLTALIQYSWNGGANWETVAVDVAGSSYTLDPAYLRGTDSALFRVQVSDGFNTATDQTDAVFSVVAKAPEIVVHSPADGAVVEANVPLRLFASAYDVEDGEIPSENFTWTSDVDGALGTGSDINVILSLGTHTLTVTASDSDTNAPSVPLTVTVANMVNDNFDRAKVVNFVPYTRTQTTAGATYVPQDQVPYCGNAIGATVWYRFTAPADAIYTFDTLDSDYDTVLALWTGEHGAMIPAGCNDDAVGQQSILELPLTEGTTYHIMIAGNDGATGNLTFNLSSPTPILDAPDDYSATENRQPTFSWSAASGAVSYEIQISQQYPPEGMPIPLTQTSYTPPSPLFTATYYWRVRAVRGDSTRTDWSETRVLTIIAPSNAAPIRYFYITPAVTLTWNSMSWATTYQVEIYDNEALTGTPIDTFTGDALEMTTIPLAEGVYYWRMRGIGTSGTGAWGKVEAFGVGG